MFGKVQFAVVEWAVNYGPCDEITGARGSIVEYTQTVAWAQHKATQRLFDVTGGAQDDYWVTVEGLTPEAREELDRWRYGARLPEPEGELDELPF